jgi:hypothetical protein
MDILVSMTSIPPRFSNSLKQVLEYTFNSLKESDFDFRILVTIPVTYKKWGSWNIDNLLKSLPQNGENKIFFQIVDLDWGPATKLIGAVDYCQKHEVLPEFIFTIDDDIIFDSLNESILTYIEKYRTLRTQAVMTSGGIVLDHEPYKYGDGLKYDTDGDFVDAVAGYKGVLYPYSMIGGYFMYFLKDIITNYPVDIFNDDDASIGITLSKANKPIYGFRNVSSECFKCLDGGYSGVQDKVSSDRIVRESEIYQIAVQREYIKKV